MQHTRANAALAGVQPASPAVIVQHIHEPAPEYLPINRCPVPESAIRRAHKAGQIRLYRPGAIKQPLVKVEDLRAWIEGSPITPDRPAAPEPDDEIDAALADGGLTVRGGR